MPETPTLKRAKRDLREGKSPSTAAGEFVHEEINHVRSGKHGARSAGQAIAIGLSKARRAGVPLRPPGSAQSKRTRRAAKRDTEVGKAVAEGRRPSRPSAKRARAAKQALAGEGHAAASHHALSIQSRRGRGGRK
jgi:hypothetical protein